MWNIAIEATIPDQARLNLSTEIHGGLKELKEQLEIGADAVNVFFDRLDEGPEEPELEATLGVSQAGCCGGIHGADFPTGFATLVQGEPLLPNDEPLIIFIISEA